MNVLDRLAMLPEDVHTNDCLVEVWVGRLNQLIVQVFLGHDTG